RTRGERRAAVQAEEGPGGIRMSASTAESASRRRGDRRDCRGRRGGNRSGAVHATGGGSDPYRVASPWVRRSRVLPYTTRKTMYPTKARPGGRNTPPTMIWVS